MKIIDYSFPHPVLTKKSSYFKNSELDAQVELQKGKKNYKLSICLTHNNQDLKKLICDDKAEYFCEITCSATLLRDIYTSASENFEFDIPNTKLRGKVELMLAIVAKKDIEGYQNSDIYSEFFDDIDFYIEKGDVLAHFASVQFDADIKYENLKAVGSIMEIVRNNDENITYSNFNFSNDKIEIIMPSFEYDLFIKDSISKEQKFSSIFHSSIVFSTLITALYNFENHKDALWAKAINTRLQNEDQFKNISIDDRENIPEIAQRLLDNPFKRLILGLHNNFSVENQID